MMGLFAWEREDERDAMAVVLAAPKGRKGMKECSLNLQEKWMKSKSKKWHNLCSRKRLDIFDRFFQMWSSCDRIKYVDSFKIGLGKFGDHFKYKISTR